MQAGHPHALDVCDHDLPGVALGGLGLLGLVWGLVNGNADGWTSPQIVASLLAGSALLGAFVAWELRTPQPMLPIRCFRDRAFSAANGASLGMFFAPVANVVVSAVRPVEEGKASGANNAIREVGGVFGVAVLASIFSRYGGYESAAAFNDGLVVATWVGAGVVTAGAVLAFMIPPKRQTSGAAVRDLVPQPEGV